MTREEASKILRDMLSGPIVPPVHPGSQKQEAIRVALTALRGPTREMVERMRGEWEPFGGKYISRKKCSRCGWDGQEHIKFYSWCPACGAPMTDEAVDMMLERWKEALDGETGRR